MRNKVWKIGKCIVSGYNDDNWILKITIGSNANDSEFYYKPKFADRKLIYKLSKNSSKKDIL